MAESVKPRRRYRSPLRDRQAQRTRDGILDAAVRLLEQDGYAAATLRRIADAAGVSVETVYAVFGSKAALLVAVGGRNLNRAFELIPGGGVNSILHAQDLDAQLEAFGALAPAVMGPNWAIMEAMRSGAAGDPELAEAYRAASDGRRGWMRQFVEAWSAAGLLRAGLDPTAATDILWTLTSPDLYRLLVVELGWAPSRYAAWLSQAARDLVLG